MPLILIHSPKGGVGCTTIAANIAAWLGRGGRPVTAVDFALHETMGFHLPHDGPRPAGSAAGAAQDGIDGQASGRSAVRLVGRASGLGIEQLFQEVDRALALEPAGGNGPSPLVVADVPSGDRAVLERLAGRALIHLAVLAADAGSAALLPALLAERPLAPGAPRIHIVLNLLDERRAVARAFHRLLRDAVGQDLVAVIRRDEAVNEALATLASIYDHAPASAAAADIAALADRIAASIDAQRPARQDVAA